ncbi:MAG: hypothetical protein AB8V21_09410 [Arsenophonus endosymbiont of Dermacentor nuttalli]
MNNSGCGGKVDQLVNLVGKLIITQSMLCNIASNWIIVIVNS